MNYIVFQCYGNERVFHECGYALLSLYRLYTGAELKDTEIWIYTDNPGWFQTFRDSPIPLHFRQVDVATIKAWRGSIDFVHRVKIEVLKDLTQNKNGNILYVDTDVVFTHRIEKIFRDLDAGKLYMHIREGKVNDKTNPVFKKLDDYLISAQLKIKDKPLNEMSMWNAGVLGFNTRHNHLLDDILTFTDREYPKFSKHVVEQFACSAYFQSTDEIKAAAPYIFHYWNLKEAGSVLASFFTYFKGKGLEQLVQYSMLLQVETLMQEKVNFLSNHRLQNAISGKKWAPANYDWAELVKQL